MGLPARLLDGRQPLPLAVPGRLPRSLRNGVEPRQGALRAQRGADAERPAASRCSSAARPTSPSRSRSATAPATSARSGTGRWAARWAWVSCWVYWVEMVKDPVDPDPARRSGLAPEPRLRRGVRPVDAHAHGVDARPGPERDADVRLRRRQRQRLLVPVRQHVRAEHDPRGRLLERARTRRPRCGWRGCLAGSSTARPEYRTADGWSPNRNDAVAISSRFFAENPMQPRYIDGQWVAATKVDGYWGEDLVIDVAADPWGPWTPVDYFRLQPRGNDPLEEHATTPSCCPTATSSDRCSSSCRTTPATCCATPTRDPIAIGRW